MKRGTRPYKRGDRHRDRAEVERIVAEMERRAAREQGLFDAPPAVRALDALHARAERPSEEHEGGQA
jgi:hypothetical protein